MIFSLCTLASFHWTIGLAQMRPGQSLQSSSGLDSAPSLGASDRIGLDRLSDSSLTSQSSNATDFTLALSNTDTADDGNTILQSFYTVDDSDKPESQVSNGFQLRTTTRSTTAVPEPTAHSSPLHTQVLVDSTKRWACLSLPDFALNYVMQSGFNGWHFRINGINPLRKIAETSAGGTKSLRMKERLSRSPAFIEMQPPLLSQATHRESIRRPVVPVEWLAIIQQKATIRFNVFYLVSPRLLFKILMDMANHNFEQVRGSAKGSPWQREYLAQQTDIKALARFIRFGGDMTIPFINVTRPAEDFLKLFNDPTNGAGMMYELGELRESFLMDTEIYGGVEGHLKGYYRYKGYGRDIITQDCAEVLQQCLNSTAKAYMSFIAGLQDYFNQHHTNITGHRPRDFLLGDELSHHANARYQKALANIDYAVHSNRLSRKNSEWVKRLRDADITQYPADLTRRPTRAPAPEATSSRQAMV